MYESIVDAAAEAAKQGKRVFQVTTVGRLGNHPMVHFVCGDNRNDARDLVLAGLRKAVTPLTDAAVRKAVGEAIMPKKDKAKA